MFSLPLFGFLMLLRQLPQEGALSVVKNCKKKTGGGEIMPLVSLMPTTHSANIWFYLLKQGWRMKVC